MNIFLLISIPAILIWAILTNPEYRWTSFVPPALTGLLVAIITCFIKEFFIFYSHIATSNFIAHFAYLSARDSIIPLTVLSLIFMLFSKDDADYKAESVLPLALSFFTVYIPYFIITGKEPQAMFLLIVKPILFIALGFITSAILKRMFAFMNDKNSSLTAISIFLTVIALVIPSLIETIWYYNINAFIWIISSIIYVAAAMTLRIMPGIQRKSE